MDKREQLINDINAIAQGKDSKEISAILIHGRNLRIDIKSADRDYYIRTRISDPRLVDILTRIVAIDAFDVLLELKEKTGQTDVPNFGS